jgi:UDP-N-acetylglucosamine:LPS N-acetylglucosamine transferase
MKIALVCTHGGHLTQTLLLLDAFQGHEFFFATHHSVRDDHVLKIAPTYFSDNIGERPIRLFSSLFWALNIILNEQPDVILSLGAEIALPFFFWGKLFRIKSIYIESWSRVNNLSRTGRIAYYLVDVFWVQWPQLLKVCGPKARYMGALI